MGNAKITLTGLKNVAKEADDTNHTLTLTLTDDILMAIDTAGGTWQVFDVTNWTTEDKDGWEGKITLGGDHTVAGGYDLPG